MRSPTRASTRSASAVASTPRSRSGIGGVDAAGKMNLRLEPGVRVVFFLPRGLVPPEQYLSSSSAHLATLFEPLPDSKVRCTACARYCTIPEGSHGFCFVRKNEGGRLVLLSYGRASAVQVDPVEKKPLSHYHPGSRVYSIGTVGCNWRCLYCQNSEISQEQEVSGRLLSPRAAVEGALRFGCQGITFTYNEPTIFIEYALDVMREGHRAGLFGNFVTNGYMTPEAVTLLGSQLDAVSVDFKGSGEPGFMRKYITAKGRSRSYRRCATSRSTASTSKSPT